MIDERAVARIREQPRGRGRGRATASRPRGAAPRAWPRAAPSGAHLVGWPAAGRSPRPGRCRRPRGSTSATWRSAKNIALSAGPPRPPLRPSIVMAPSSEATMFTSSHGRSACGGPGLGRRRARRRRRPRRARATTVAWRRTYRWQAGGRWSITRRTHHHVAHPHAEPHRSNRAGWLRAAVLGANDGVVSTACLIVGVAGAGAQLRRRSAPRGSPGWRPARCRWRWGSTCRWRASATSRRPTCASSARPSRSTRWPSCGSWRRSGRRGASSPSWRWRWPASSPSKDALEAHARDELGLTAGHGRPPGAGGAHVGGGVHPRRAGAAGGVPRGRRTTAAPRSSWRPRWWPSSASGGWVRCSARPSRLRAMARVGLGGAAAMGITLLIGELTGAALG